MKKLITTNTGGMPEPWETFRWYEESIVAVLADLAKGLGLGGEYAAFKLWGAQVSNNGAEYQVTEGAIYMNGEIYRVPAHSLQLFPGGTTGTYYWSVETSYDPAGQFNFENGDTFDTFQIREAKLFKVSPALQAGTFVALNIPTITELWTRKSIHDQLTATVSAIQTKVNAIGAAYYYVKVPDVPQGYGAHQQIVWEISDGHLVSGNGHLTVKAGGVYLIDVVRTGAGASLRLNLGIVNYSLNEGKNILRSPASFNLTGNFEHIQDATFEIVVTLLAIANYDEVVQGGLTPPG